MEELSKCERCEQILSRLRWNTKGDISVCNNPVCEKSYQPQRFIPEYRKDIYEVLGRKKAK